MPKQKTHKGAAKRFNLTKTGKVKRAQAFKRHILTKKPTKRTRNLRKALSSPRRSANSAKIRRSLPLKKCACLPPLRITTSMFA